MSAVPKRNWTAEQYFAFESKSQEKHQFFDGEIFAMAGASRQHNDLNSNLGRRDLPATQGQTLQNVHIRYAREDLSHRAVHLSELLDRLWHARVETIVGVDTLLNPFVVFEILSDSSEAFDRALKFQPYQKLPSVREYILISQDRVEVFHRTRLPEDSWDQTILNRLSDELVLSSVAVRLSLADLYHGVDLPNPPLSRSAMSDG